MYKGNNTKKTNWDILGVEMSILGVEMSIYLIILLNRGLIGKSYIIFRNKIQYSRMKYYIQEWKCYIKEWKYDNRITPPPTPLKKFGSLLIKANL